MAADEPSVKRVDSQTGREPVRLVCLLLCGVTLCGISLAINLLSPSFNDATVKTDRPILQVMILLTVAFAVYIGGLVFALTIRNTCFVFWTVVSVAIAARLLLLGSYPFQEIDAYRYIWDGNVLASGVSHYEFSPDEAKAASLTSQNMELRHLAELRDQDPGLNAILHRVHFSNLPTVYPPVSQGVFWLSATTTPLITAVSQSRPKSLMGHLVAMKFWITVFDIGTLVLVFLLLRQLKMHVGWAIAYGWSPLILKEFANTGHLDSIAIFFCTAAIYLLLRLVFTGDRTGFGKGLLVSVVLGTMLACGVGAKLFPIVLGPLFAFVLIRKLGWTAAIVFSLVAIGGSLWFFSPILSTSDPVDKNDKIVDAVEPNKSKSSDGLYAFLSQWRMNDFIFMNIQENIEHPQVYENRQPPWFVIVPDKNRKAINEWLGDKRNELSAKLQGDKRAAEAVQLPQAKTSFIVARLITLCLFGGIAVVLAWRAARFSGNADQFDEARWKASILSAAFLTLAWFWMTLPTQNPWYWCWAMPLVCFARNRWWLSMGLFATIYYLRFWFRYHLSDEQILGTGYNGPRYFDFVVTWIEYVPFLVVLIVTTMWQSLRRRRISNDS